MRGDVVASVIGAAAGAGVVVASLRLGIGTVSTPGPGLFPVLGGAGLLLLSAVLLGQARRGGSRSAEAFGEWRRPAILVAGLCLYAAILEAAGYVLATALIAALVLRLLGVTSWRVVAVASVVLSAGTYLLFVRILGVELPAGAW